VNEIEAAMEGRFNDIKRDIIRDEFKEEDEKDNKIPTINSGNLTKDSIKENSGIN
jgi:hypothetical protein